MSQVLGGKVDARQFTALQMLASSIDVSVSIPRRVFAPEFNDVFVMDFAWLIDRRAVDLMKMLIRVAGPPEVPVLTHFGQSSVTVLRKANEGPC
jgi:hypothetical protein